MRENRTARKRYMLEVGTLLDGKYKILSEIGHGGMSNVYMAINEKANKTWAVKEVRKNGNIDFVSIKQGLISEIQILKSLRHPNLPSIVDVLEDEESFLIVMDYIEGNSLQKTLREYGAIPQKYVISWAKVLCSVLIYLHSKVPPIIYRDMKPGNIMLKPDGNIMLIDFGTAREYKASNLEDTVCLGTVGYAAPEQFGGMGQTDIRTDIYGLGATLYHMITGQNPGKAPYEIVPIRQVNASLSSGLEKIIAKCTQKNPNDRYQSAVELMYALEHYEEMDDAYRKKQVRRWSVFFSVVFCLFISIVGGMLCDFFAMKESGNIYETLFDRAEKTTDYKEKLELYEACIEVSGKSGELEAYLGLIRTYKEDDFIFSTEESSHLMRCIQNHKHKLQENVDNYVQLCFEVGKLYWYYFVDLGGAANLAVRGKYAAEWFSDVIFYAKKEYVNWHKYMQGLVHFIETLRCM